MTLDFTHKMYKALLLTLKENGYIFYRFKDYAEQRNLNHLHVILRHDVDRFPKRALKLARLENKLNIVSSFFFRAKSVSFNTAIINQIKKLGHEVGYHYEELSDAKGNYDLALRLFQKNKKKFEPFGGITTIAMHGRPFSKWDNQDLWKHYHYKELGILLDASQDLDWLEYIYLTDTGRSWNNAENRRDRIPLKKSEDISVIQHTPDLLSFLKSYKGNLVISTHPERWSDSLISWMLCFLQDGCINQCKKLIRYGS